jgi:ferric-dicitrate binding protein FerR (iron transport regulator)
MVQYDKKYNKISVKKVNTADFICWKEGYLIFNDDPMAAVIERLQRKFNIEITVKNKEVYKSIFTANFKDEGLNEILDYIAYSCPIKYTTHKETNESKKQIDFFYESK